jgi:hypothetical protein
MILKNTIYIHIAFANLSNFVNIRRHLQQIQSAITRHDCSVSLSSWWFTWKSQKIGRYNFLDGSRHHWRSTCPLLASSESAWLRKMLWQNTIIKWAHQLATMCFSLFFTTSPIDSHYHQRLADSWLQRLYSLVFWQCDEFTRKSNGVSKKDYMQFLFNLFNIAQSYPQTACWKDPSTIWMSECTKDSCSHYEHGAGISPKARAWVRTSAIPRNIQKSTWL